MHRIGGEEKGDDDVSLLLFPSEENQVIDVIGVQNRALQGRDLRMQTSPNHEKGGISIPASDSFCAAQG